jgi:hypothetical protein
MKRLVSFVFLGAALLVFPAIASAQGYYGPPPPPYGGGYYARPPAMLPGGFYDRTGRLALGFSIGLGAMHSNAYGDITCPNCDYNPAAVEVDFHVGGMIAPRFALLFEVQGNLQTIDQDAQGDTLTLSQGTAMVAGQFWLTPRLWVKGGIGAAHLSYDTTDYYGNSGGSQPISNGAAVMGAIGYELFSTREFAVDLQGRLIEGSYKDLGDQITSGTVGVGFNWY